MLTAKDTQVPVIANRMKISNHFASVIWELEISNLGSGIWISNIFHDLGSGYETQLLLLFCQRTVMQICRIGFFSLKRKMDLLARSGGGFT